MVMRSSKRSVARLSKMILSSSVGVGGGVWCSRTVSGDGDNCLVEVVVVVSPVVAAVVVVRVGVIRLWGAALSSPWCLCFWFRERGLVFLAGRLSAGGLSGRSFFDCFFCPGRIEESAEEEDECDDDGDGDDEGG